MDKPKNRRYPKAFERLGGNEDQQSSKPGTAQKSSLPSHFWAPTVRRGIAVTREETEDVPVEDTAKRAFLAENPDGTHGFQIEIKDELFDNLRCSINILEDGRVQALFHVQDDNLRRLLEAESGRLRSQLEDKGLKVSEVRVVMGSPE